MITFLIGLVALAILVVAVWALLMLEGATDIGLAGFMAVAIAIPSFVWICVLIGRVVRPWLAQILLGVQP